nr:hypothetical protein [Hafnia alvei]
MTVTDTLQARKARGLMNRSSYRELVILFLTDHGSEGMEIEDCFRDT